MKPLSAPGTQRLHKGKVCFHSALSKTLVHLVVKMKPLSAQGAQRFHNEKVALWGL